MIVTLARAVLSLSFLLIRPIFCWVLLVRKAIPALRAIKGVLL